jgi:predicted dehydrogenase
MSEKLRVGILGAGWAGGGHAQAFSRLKNVEVSAIWSRTRKRAEDLAAGLKDSKIQVYDQWQELIEKANPDIVSLTAAATLRREPVIKALEHDCHLLVEKPFSVGLDAARAMVQAGEKASTVTSVCFNFRYAPGCQSALREIQDEKLGKIRDICLEWRLSGLPADFLRQRPCAADLNIGDGLLGEGIIHDFDRTRFLTGCEFVKVVSLLATRSLPLEPDFMVEGGSCAVLSELTNDVSAFYRIILSAGLTEWSISLSGEKCTLLVTHEKAVRQCADDAEPVSLDIPEQEKLPKGLDMQQHTWNRLIEDFVCAVRRGDAAHSSCPHLPFLEDGLRAQEVVAAARQSEEAGRWVALDELS